MNGELKLKTFRNGDSIAVQDVPEVALVEFLQAIVELTGLGWRIASYFGVPEQEGVAPRGRLPEVVLLERAQGRAQLVESCCVLRNKFAIVEAYLDHNTQNGINERET